MTKWKKGRVIDYMLEFPTVQYWQSQLRTSGHKNIQLTYTGTKTAYIHWLRKFNEWLHGRRFDVRISVITDNKITHKNTQMTFSNVEELLHFGEDGNVNTKEIKKIINMYLVEPTHNHLSLSSMASMCAAIKSYFNVNDVEIDIKYNKRKRDDFEVRDDAELTIPEFYKMLTYSKIDHTTRAIMMIKFQAGLDASTLADRFNYQAYSQIAKFCNSTNHREWNIDKCPIPIRLVRVKTGVAFTTFIDRDGLSAIKDYLAWREETRGPHKQDGPIFFTSKDVPVQIRWISNTFAKLAKYSQVQKKLSPHKHKITPHEVRDLLKTTLLVCGCPEHMADHIIGHKPHDSYVKISKLYPERLRQEYAKASHMLNIFSHAENKIKNPEPPGAMESVLKASEDKVETLLKRVNELEVENSKKDDKNTDVEQKVNNMMKAILEALDSDPNTDLRKNLKEKFNEIL